MHQNLIRFLLRHLWGSWQAARGTLSLFHLHQEPACSRDSPVGCLLASCVELKASALGTGKR